MNGRERVRLRDAVAKMAARYGMSMYDYAAATTEAERERTYHASRRQYSATLRLLWALAREADR